MNAGVIVTATVHVGLVCVMWVTSVFGGFDGTTSINDDRINVIETGLAVRKKRRRGHQSRLPRKPRQAKRTVKGVGIPSDANAKEPEENFDDIFDRFRGMDIDEEDVGEEGTEEQSDVGEEDGSDFGTLADAKGDPYVGELIGRMSTNPDMVVPSVVRPGGLETWGCVKLNASGKIGERYVHPDHKSKSHTFNRAVEERLKIATDMPKPIPPHLSQLLKDGICARYTY